MPIRLIKSLLGIAALAFVLVGTQTTQAAGTSYIGTNWEPEAIPGLTPKWSLAVDIPEQLPGAELNTLAVGGGQTYAIQQGSLVAANAKTGKIAWKFGAKLASPVLYNQGIVYVLSKDGYLYAVNAATGKKKWGTAFKPTATVQLYVNGSRLYVMDGNLQAFDTGTGKKLWTDDVGDGLYGALWFGGGKILLSGQVSGAYSYNVIRAIDEQTGRQTWLAENEDKPLLVKGDSVLAQRTSTPFEQPEGATLDTLDLKTGKVAKTVAYKQQGSLWIDSDRVYIGSSKAVYAYPLDADPAQTTVSSYVPQGGYTPNWSGGPAAGRVLFTDGTLLIGVKLADKSTVPYGWLGNSIARFDTIGNGAYVALTDGKVIGLNLVTGKRVFQLQMPTRVFGPTLQADGMILVQSKGRVSAFPEPAQLKGS